MENNYANKDNKEVNNDARIEFNEYNLMSFNSSSSYQEYLKTLQKDKSKLIQSFAGEFEESYNF